MSKSKKTVRVILNLLIMLCLTMLTAGQVAARTTPPLTIHTPGNSSTVISPIHIRADVTPGENGLVRVALMDEFGMILSRQLLKLSIPNNHHGPVTLETWLAFEIPVNSRKAQLIISTEDEYRRPIALRSVSLTLQSSGSENVLPVSQPTPWLVLEKPLPNDHFSGGLVPVQGTITPLNTTPVYFELITDSGGVIGAIQLFIPEDASTLEFDLKIPYQFITETRNVRLIIRQSHPALPGNAILESLVLSLTP